tara:strand:+ start:179 stop:397 length:219 start_codon:yes stop_codon:yes gene_type:complete
MTNYGVQMRNLFWKLLNLLVLILLVITVIVDYLSKKPQAPLDNQPIDATMKGEWKRFGELNFNDKVWVTNER